MDPALSRSADAVLVDALRRPDLLNRQAASDEIIGAGFTAVAAATSVILDDPIVSREVATSFVLHAPLELLARCALADQAEPGPLATARLVSLASRYAARHPTTRIPPTTGMSLDDAIDAGDSDAAEAAAVALGVDAPTAIARSAVSRTSAAGHATIYVHLEASVDTTTMAPMVRGLTRELARDPRARIAVDVATPTPSLVAAFEALRLAGPPSARGIAALVDHVTAADADGIGRVASAAVVGVPHLLLRLAAAQMISGSDAVVPYGWTHALTLTQGALATAAAGADPVAARVAAGVYASAFWSAYGADGIPEAYDGNHPVGDWEPLVTAALAAHDAHLVKYTLACLQCADADPEGAGLFYAAASRLHRWWAANPPVDDPLPISMRVTLDPPVAP